MTSQDYVTNTAASAQQALERMQVRSSAIGREMVKKFLPVPETRQDIERYIRSLLTENTDL